MRIDNQTGALQSYGYIPSSSQTTFLTQHSILKSIAQKNRIITQVGYKESIQTGDSTISIAPNRFGAGLYICDYDGNYIDFIDYGIDAPSVILSGSVSLHDSILYIMGGSRFDLTLAGTQLFPTGNSVAYIAKYVDTSFMTPYVYTGDTGGVRIPEFSIFNSQFSIYPNPTSSIVNIRLPEGETVSECYVISSTGVCNKERLTANTLNLSKYPSGIYYIQIIANSIIHKHKIIKL